MILKDNSPYSSTSENLEEFLSLQNVANRTLSELTDECGNNLLIYPYSFEECEDKIGNQPLMSLQTDWKGKQCTKVHLTTGNLVGFIGVNRHSVSIQSRFAQHTGEDFFLHYMLQKVLYINLFRMPHETSDEAVFDFLLYLFPKFLHEALAQGIYKEYQRNTYNDANVRGVIDISRQIKCNMPFNGRIAYRTREFSLDNQVTELIRHTLEYICTTRFGRALWGKRHPDPRQCEPNQDCHPELSPARQRKRNQTQLEDCPSSLLHPLCASSKTLFTDTATRKNQIRAARESDTRHFV